MLGRKLVYVYIIHTYVYIIFNRPKIGGGIASDVYTRDIVAFDVGVSSLKNRLVLLDCIRRRRRVVLSFPLAYIHIYIYSDVEFPECSLRGDMVDGQGGEEKGATVVD